ncbi:flagellar assembly protein FliW [Bremerella sp. T1]|uniref:flagellar assembly protein FliW n=1 Tax=Bremerella sp. TYQ1 TaxID=3119568 RepID=UPI001CCB780D|nr:flagellar assembly protein FliW [Bremerella volcania]UBM35256.1 flagellar assembly protein FliW [Bremerella volcania]
MEVQTTRFGKLDIRQDEIITFAGGLIGFDTHTKWAILADESNESVGWLQSMEDPGLAFAVVSPRRYIPSYKVRISPEQANSLKIDAGMETFVLVIVSRESSLVTVNLRAPLLINLSLQVGRQVITTDEQPLRHVIATETIPLRRSA